MLPLRLIGRRARRRAVVAVPAVAALAYFTYHAFYGEAGYASWLEVRAEVTRLEAELARVRAHNAELEGAIEGLRPDRPDPDAIETELRRLGYVRNDEIVVLDDGD